MVNFRRYYYNLLISLFFICSAIINTAYYFITNNHELLKLRLLENSLLSIPFLLLFIFKYTQIEIEISVVMILWSLYAVLMKDTYILEVSLMLSFGIMLILKKTKLKTIPVLVLIAFVFTFNVCSIIINKNTILEFSKSIMVVWLMCYTIHELFYRDFKVKPYPIDFYKFTDDEKSIMDELNKKNPSNKNIAAKLNMSEIKVKKDLTSIFKKLEITSGGSQRVELVSKLYHLGYYK